MKKFMGQTPEKKDPKKGEEGMDTYVIGKKEAAKVWEDQGVTQDTLKTVNKARRNITFEGMKSTGEETAKTGRDTRIKLGSGNGSLIMTTKAKKERTVGDAVEVSYGTFSVTSVMPTPGDKEFKETHAEVREKIEKKVADK